MKEAEQIMKRCQAGTRNYEEANNLHAACYGMIGKLLKQRTWVGLTDEEVRDLWSWSATSEAEKTANTQQHAFARAIEAKLKQKNGFAEEKNT
jgi:hypothetical protein